MFAMDCDQPKSSALTISSSLIVAQASAPFTSSALVVSGEKPVTLVNSGRSFTRTELKETYALQRNSQNYWRGSFIFPNQENLQGGDRNVFCRDSLIRTKQFVCLGLCGCPFGDCLHSLETVDISAGRQRLANTIFEIKASRLGAGKTTECLTREHLVSELRRKYDRTTQKFNFMTVSLSAIQSVTMCVASYLLMLGISPTMAYNIVTEVKSDAAYELETFKAPSVARGPKGEREEFLKYSNDFIMVREYVESLKSAYEQNPAPGASRKEETNVGKASWRARMAQMTEYFKKAGTGYVPGNEAMLKRAWKFVDGLIELRQMSHAKCTTCALADAKLWHLRGVSTSEAKEERRLIELLLKEHTNIHLGARRIMDNHAFLSFTMPRSVWCMLVDAATCRNFLLPRFSFRTPKNFGTIPYWGYKLMAAYAHGFGFFPYLIHNSQSMGANLLWTVTWLTLCKMRRKQGCYADVLFLTLDNTSSENKNHVMLAMGCWLVATGRFKQVRVFFLHVGHTHVIIDQIFGVITVGLRGREVLLPEDLIANIEATLHANPKYMGQPLEVLHHLWDFTSWVDKEMKPKKVGRICGAEKVADEAGAYHGMKDFIFNADPEKLARLQYREQHDHPLLPAGSTGCQVITCLPTAPPPLQKIKPFETWGKIGTSTFQATVSLVLRHARSVPTAAARSEVQERWLKHIEDVPSDISLLNPAFLRQFEDFYLVTPRLTFQPVDVDNSQEPHDSSLANFKAVHFALRTTPLAVDPVISSEQSEAEWSHRHQAWLATLVDGPTSDTMSGLALAGAMCLARKVGEGLALYKIEELGPCQGSRSAALDLKCIRWGHNPQPGVSGFWGTFEMDVNVENGKSRQVKRILTRSEVMVWNVKLVDHTSMKTGRMGRTPARVLSIESLKELSRKLPLEYPFPQDIPVSHAGQAKRAGRAKRNNDPERRDNPEVALDSSSEDEYDFSASGRQRRQAPRSKKTEGSARAAKTSAAEQTEDAGDGEDDEDEDRRSTGDEEEDESEESEEEGDTGLAEGLAGEGVYEEDEVEDQDTGTNEILLLPPPPFAFRPESFVWVDLNGTSEARLHYPAALAFVGAVFDEELSVYWFGAPKFKGRQIQWNYPALKKGDKDAKVAFPKFWTTLPKNGKKKAPAGRKKRKGPAKSSEVQTVDTLRQAWGMDAKRIKKNWCLKLDVPFAVTSAASPEEVFLASDDVFIKLEYLHHHLIPHCKAIDCEIH